MNQKQWNWQRPEWPNFIYNKSNIEPLERQYALLAGEFKGALKHISHKQPGQITIDLLSHEALETSLIEGEILDRNSVQSSIQGHLGLNPVPQKSKPAESGIADMMIDLLQNFAPPLSYLQLSTWHKSISQGNPRVNRPGMYRDSSKPMQIVSGPYGHEKIHFEAPPSKNIDIEMETFITWFNATEKTMSPLTRASLAHLYFVCIHPYEDGNGRISRALVEKTLSQYQKSPALTNLSRTIMISRKSYYDALERNNQRLEVTDWIMYLGQSIIDSQIHTLKKVDLTIQKTKLYDQYRGQINDRQVKIIEKLFAAEPEGFAGGLSAEKYLAITKTSRATATRDLHSLVELNILIKTGELRYTRYYLNLE